MRFFLLLLCIIFSNYAKAQLSGTYTINANKAADSLNYTSIGAAISDLAYGTRPDSSKVNGPGVSDHVTFLIADGIYKEKVLLEYIVGASDTSRILFKSASGNSSKVIITWPSDSFIDKNYVLKLSSANYCTFSDLTFQRTGKAPYATLLHLYDTRYTTITNCKFNAGAISSEALDAVAVDASGNNNYAIYKNLVIDSVSVGINLNGLSKKNIVEHCKINYFSYGGILLSHHDSTIVRNNSIGNNKYEGYGIHTYLCNNIQLLANKINLPNGGSGIADYESANDTMAVNLIANNMISITGGKFAYGMSFTRTKYLDVINNSVNVGDSTGFERITMSFSDGGAAKRHQRIFNNNLANYGGGYVMYIPKGSHRNFDSLGHNNYYSTGPYFGMYEDLNNHYDVSPIYSSFWNSTVNDRKSLMLPPQFNSSTDLHTDAFVFNGKGKVWPNVKTDFDGEKRDTLKPDIGADEFNIYSNDLKVFSVQKPVKGQCLDTADLNVTVINNGSAALTSLKLVWKLNGKVQDTFTKTVRIPSGYDSTYAIGKISWSSNKFDEVTVISLDTSDDNSKNDTLTVNYRKGISGTFSLGTDSSDYKDIAAALQDLYEYGVCGNTTFEIADGIYSKQIEILPILGAGKNSRITFKSASGDSNKVVLTEFANGRVLNFNGADYVTFQGLTILDDASYIFGQLILFQKQAKHNELKNCVIIGEKTNYPETWVIKDKGFGNDSNLIENNIIRFGDAPIIFGDDPIQSDSKSYGNIIKDNAFDSAYSSGIKLYYQYGVKVIGNKYVSTISGFDTAFYLSKCNNNVRVGGNYILLKHGGSGLILDNCDAYYTTMGVISNNIIDIGANSGKNCYGIYMAFTNFFDIVHNTIRIGKKQGQLTSNLFFDVGWGLSGNKFHYVFNNIFINESDGYTLWASSNSRSYRVIDSSDNNVFHSPKVAHIMYNLGIGDIAAWRYSSGFDSKSFLLYPKFINKDSMLTYDSRLNEQGAPLTKVTTDIQGDKRSSTKPDIGADEFEPLKNDVFVEAQVFPTGLICKGFHQAKVRIKNTGTDMLKSIIIGYKIDEVFQDTISFKVSVPSDKDTILSLGKFYYGDTVRWYKIYSSLPNNKFDRNQGNDTILSPIRSALKDTYTVANSGSYYNSLKMALNHLDSFGICGPVVFNIEDGYYEERMMVKNYHGSRGKNSVTFRGSSGDSSKVWIEPRFPDGYDSNYVVSINYAQNIIFEGVTISSAHTDNRTVVEIKNSASQIQFRKCQVISSWDFFDDASLIKASDNCDSIVVKGNLLKRANNGIWFIGKSNTSKIKNIIIEDNVFEDIWYKNIYLNNIINVAIKRNVIDSGETGIDLNGITGSLAVTYNRIQVKINYMHYNSSNSATGIYISGVFSQNDRGLVANNMVYIDSKYYGVGINAGSRYLDVFHNTVKVQSEDDESTALHISAGDGTQFNNYLNNLLINIGKGYAISIWVSGNFYYPPHSDYNLLYTNGKYIGRGYTTRSLSLKDWIKDTKLDSHSINVLPVFKDSFDLHTQDVNINGKAKPLASVTDDFDNEKRSFTKPDIGADEFDPIAHDVALTGILPINNGCADTVTYFGVIIENKGNNSETNFKLNLQISGSTTALLDSVYKSTLVSGQIDTLYFSKVFNTSKGGKYTLSGWHNLSSDLDRDNDSMYSSIQLLKRVAVPLISDTIICKGIDLMLKPAKSLGLKLLWYTSENQATPFFTGDSMVVKNINKDAVYFVAAKDTVGCESYRIPVKVTLKQAPAGADLLQGTVFSGNFNRGTENNPDAICEGSQNEYIIQKPKGFDNATYGKDWKISLLEVIGANTNILMKDTSVTWPSASGAGKIAIKPSVTGSDRSYKLRMVINDLSSGCDTTIVRFFDVFALPKVKWSASSTCESEWTSFIDSSENGNAYLWKFSDGSTSTSKNTTFQFTKAGDYKVKLKVFNYLGCVDSVERTVTIHPLPEVDFQLPVYICAGDIFSIQNNSTFNSSLSYTWNFDDNTTSADSNVSHTYFASGTYAISLKATSPLGCSKTLTKFLRVYDKPEANFTLPDSVCEGETATFTNNSKRSVGYLWRISTGDSLTTNHANYVFAKPGKYSVQLVAYNASNCSDTIQKNITVLPKPEVDFEAANICIGDSAVFKNKSNSAGTAKLSYLWRFGDGTVSSLENPMHLYQKPGIYDVTLIAITMSGCKDSIKSKITVGAGPKAVFTSGGACINKSFIFTDHSQVAGAKIVSRKWDFGNGNISADSVVQVQFNKPGKYTITLDVTTSQGCSAVTVDTIEVFDLPEVSYAADTVCTGLAVNFRNTSKGYADGKWYFGDGDSSQLTNPAHIYKAAGKYVVILEVTSLQGCTAVLTDTIVVKELPVASFYADTVCAGKQTSFINTSKAFATNLWYFGDGDSSFAFSPKHTYKSPGDYYAKMVAVSDEGCTDTFTQTVRVWELPNPEFSFITGSNGNVAFTANNTTNSTYLWDFGDGKTSDSVSPSHKFSQNGTYTVRLTTANSNGCVDTISKKVIISNVSVNDISGILTAVEIFPNPFITSFTVKYTLAQTKNVSFVLMDMYGKEILRQQAGKQKAGAYNHNIQADVASGTYMLYILIDEKAVSKKVVKVN